MKFKLWLEDIESQKEFFKSEVLDLIHSDESFVNLSDDNLLDMQIRELPNKIKQELEQRYGNMGDVGVEIKNGDIKIQDMIDKLSSTAMPSPNEYEPEKTFDEEPPQEEPIPQTQMDVGMDQSMNLGQ